MSERPHGVKLGRDRETHGRQDISHSAVAPPSEAGGANTREAPIRREEQTVGQEVSLFLSRF